MAFVITIRINIPSSSALLSIILSFVIINAVFDDSYPPTEIHPMTHRSGMGQMP